jgi:hypothetical protein
MTAIEEIQRALELSLVALQQSEPKAKHYPEPVARHEQAIKAVIAAIARNK